MTKQAIWQFMKGKIDKGIQEIGSGFPGGMVDGKYELGSFLQWTAGFWPGLLWKGYQVTGEEKYAMLAREIETELDKSLTNSEWVDHDMGFTWSLASVADYKLTGSQEARRRALLAANLLMGRFNLAGYFIRSWNDSQTEDTKGMVSIGSAMNMPLLFWASEETGDPRFRHVAEAHLSTLINHFIREDGSVAHTCVFNPETGAFVEEAGNQFLAKGSAWARGTGWTIYGFALAARYTRRPEYLDAARVVAKFFLEQLGEDTCPVWDFRAKDPHEEGRPLLDSSAAAIAANGFIALGKLTGEQSYLEDAERIVTKLYEHHSTKDEPHHQGMLKDAAGHDPKQKDLEASFIYGDYFFTEAVVSLLYQKELFW